MVDSNWVKTLQLTPKDGKDPITLTLRPLTSDADYAACVQLERKTWGEDFAELVPPSILMISQKVGGVSAGAFTASGELWAMVYGLTGLKDGKPFHWSHMLAVDPAARGLGLGREMKYYQADCLKQIGVSLISWTFEPLESLNANLNINRLGALPVDYLLDVYGSGDTSGLHAGIGTDRYVVLWDTENTHDAAAHAARFNGAEVIVNTQDGEPRTDAFDLPDLPRLRIEIPKSIQEAKHARPGLGRAWRDSTRRALQHYLAQGYRITCLLEDKDAARCYYGVERGD